MGSLLMYRGLPGGPTEVKFADELSRHCLCSQCGMITLSMYQDPNDHMFCDTCLHERSTKYGKFEIFCTYERKNIGINEMFEARDLITILRDQYVDCPNKPHCKEKVPLENLHDHFVACKRHVQCPNCRESIETKKWKDHHCPLETERAVTKAAEKSGASKEAVKGRERQEKQKPSVLRSSKSRDIEPSSSQRCGGRQTTAVSMSPAETHGRAVAFPQPDQLVAPEERGAAAPMQNSDGGNHVPEAIQVCEYCHRKVKDINMERHQKACTKAPKPCVYCETPFFPDYMQRHIQECNKNPDNVPEGRRLRTNVPEHRTELGYPIAKRQQEAMGNTLHPLQQGDIELVPDDSWSQEARVLQEVAFRSRIAAKDDGRSLRRSWQHLLQTQEGYHRIDEDFNGTSGNSLQSERPRLLQHGPSAPGFSGHPLDHAHDFSHCEASQAEHRRLTRQRKEPQRLQYDAKFRQVS